MSEFEFIMNLDIQTNGFMGIIMFSFMNILSGALKQCFPVKNQLCVSLSNYMILTEILDQSFCSKHSLVPSVLKFCKISGIQTSNSYLYSEKKASLHHHVISNMFCVCMCACMRVHRHHEDFVKQLFSTQFSAEPAI